MANTACIGCGYCCRKCPCSVSGQGDRLPCRCLRWDGFVWRCGLVLAAGAKDKKRIIDHLGIGEGCCASLNTYRISGHIPTPAELEDEPALLKMLNSRIDFEQYICHIMTLNGMEDDMQEKEWDQKKIAPVQIMMLPSQKTELKEAAQAEGKTVTDYLLGLHREHQASLKGKSDD